MTIYDKFLEDEEWQQLNKDLHQPYLTYRERDGLRASLDAKEQAIRREIKEAWDNAVNNYKAGRDL